MSTWCDALFGYKMKIRPYTPTDFDAVTTLWRRARELAFPEFQRTKGHTFEEDRAYFQNNILEENSVYVADMDGIAVAFMAIKDDFIDQLYVAPTHQRQGIGKALLEFARTFSPERLWLYTFQINTNGRAFYEKNGFIATKFGVSPPPESEPDVLYEWNK
mgnify:CR=1 FL=1